jgi:hypothetical protein
VLVEVEFPETPGAVVDVGLFGLQATTKVKLRKKGRIRVKNVFFK